MAFSRNFWAHWCLALQSRACAFYHRACSHLEICIFGPCFGRFILHPSLSRQLQEGRNGAGSMAWRLSLLPCRHRASVDAPSLCHAALAPAFKGEKGPALSSVALNLDQNLRESRLSCSLIPALPEMQSRWPLAR